MILMVRYQIIFALTQFCLNIEGRLSQGITVLTDCPGTSNSPGSITSPNYPSNYENLQSCSWLLRSHMGKISLLFERFNTERGYDYVRVYDGSSRSSFSIGNFSGSLLPGNSKVSSSNSQMFITFISDGSVTDRGFSLKYSNNVATTTKFTVRTKQAPTTSFPFSSWTTVWPTQGARTTRFPFTSWRTIWPTRARTTRFPFTSWRTIWPTRGARTATFPSTPWTTLWRTKATSTEVSNSSPWTTASTKVVKTVKKKWYRTQFIVRKYPEGNVTSDRPPRTDLPDYKKCKESPFCFSYIAAEIEGYNVTIGDGRMYNGYYNAPLEPATTYRIFTRSVSKSSDKTIEYFPAIGSYAFKTTTTKSNTKNNTDVFTAKKQEVESASWLTLPSFVAILTINIILIIAIIVITTFALRRKMFCKKKQADSTKNETAYASVEMKDRNVRNNGRKTTRYQMSPPTEQSSNDHYQSLDKTTRTTQNTVKYKNVRRELPAIPKI